MKEGTAALDIIPEFELIAPTLWQHDSNPSNPPTPGSLESIPAPSYILLFTWTGARCQNIVKYTNRYLVLFPTAHIFVITTSAKDLCFRSSKRKQARLEPLLEHLVQARQNQGITIFMHIFSEGGSNKAVAFAELYQTRTCSKLPLSALCLDSTPGHPHYRRLCTALRKSLPPHPVFHYGGFLIGSTMLAGIWILFSVFKGYHNNPISKTRRQLLNPALFDPTTPRCYLYSTADSLVAWQDIHEHVQASVDLDIPVTQVIFTYTKHCMHAKEEPEQYWGAVNQTWRKAIARHEPMLAWDMNKFADMSP
ncbi:hypothetical protein J1614_010733 [Plenodomus biglobosus]|nr:hypothetical protein J1614_010733 [Plenodomus biglobosus]